MPRLELKLLGVRSSMKSKVQSKMQSKRALFKNLADVPVNLAGVVDSGGHMRQSWHWNNIDSGGGHHHAKVFFFRAANSRVNEPD